MRIIVIIICFLILGCSKSIEPETPQGATPTSIELYISRAALTDTEFEHYKVLSSNMFRECGKVRRGRHITDHQGVNPIDEVKLLELKKLAGEVLNEPQGDHDFLPSGKNAHFADPGQLLLTLETDEKQFDIKTSLDSISQAASPAEVQVRKLVTALRHASTDPNCGKKPFFGLPGDRTK